MKTCPWCGKADDKETITEPPMGGYGDEPEIFQVRCEWCGARGSEASSKEEAIRLWEEREE